MRTWTVVDPDTKLIPTWLVGPRDETAPRAFIPASRVRITTDGHRRYIEAIEAEFARDVDLPS